MLARQKQQLNKRLGLDIAGGLGGEELFKEEDLIIQQEDKTGAQEVRLGILGWTSLLQCFTQRPVYCLLDTLKF